MLPPPLRFGVFGPRLAYAKARRVLVLGCVCLVLCAAFFWRPAYAKSDDQNSRASQWIHMPAGSRATYIGIHGGTVPVSLLTSRDGTHMVALVGQTGNDFLRTLKVDPGTRGAHPSAGPEAPSAPEAGHADEDAVEAVQMPFSSGPATPALQRAANATLLMAGTAVGAMPVIYATGHSFASLNQLYTDSLLFGISEHSPLLEGAVKAPRKATKSKAAKRRPLVRASAASYN